MTLIDDIYPGQYHPRKGSWQHFTHYGDALISQFPNSKIIAIDGTYLIRIPVPGVARENILITVSENHMIVRIVDQQRLPDDKHPGKRMKIIRKCFVQLPPDTDANFAAASVNHSQLIIELAKKETVVKNLPGQIIPY